MRFLRIIKDGIENVVDEAQFKKIYEPAGWKALEEQEPNAESAGKPDDEIRKKNINKMKRTKPQKFDDKLLRDE